MKLVGDKGQRSLNNHGKLSQRSLKGFFKPFQKLSHGHEVGAAKVFCRSFDARMQGCGSSNLYARTVHTQV